MICDLVSEYTKNQDVKYNFLNFIDDFKSFKMTEIEEIMSEIRKFRDERDWDKFHNSKDLSLAINIESSELLELFLWKNCEDFDKEKAKEELADILIYCLLFASKHDFNVRQIILDKIKKNAQKYPVEKSKGISKKYNEL
jgi:NTP pyrophosphatase (non-canonical NTP hydrolase)